MIIPKSIIFGFAIAPTNCGRIKVNIYTASRKHLMYAGRDFYPPRNLPQMIYAEWLEWFDTEKGWEHIRNDRK